MRSNWKLAFQRLRTATVVLVLAGLPAWAQEPIRIEITEVPYRPVHAFLRVHFEFAGKQDLLHQEWGTQQKDSFLGFGVGLISARNSDFQLESNISYERFKADKLLLPDLTALHELDVQVGGRFLPRYPTFGLGKIPVRLTFSGLGGLGWMFPGTYNFIFDLSMILTAGLHISSGDNPSGFLIEAIYRPLTSTLKMENIDSGFFGNVSKKPCVGIRIAWLFAPSD